MPLSLNDLQYGRLTRGEGSATALGQIAENLAVNKFGIATALPVTHATVWPLNTRKVYRSDASIMTVSSDSAFDDDITGTGARSVDLYGVDGDWEPVKETVLLDGLDAVATDNEYMIIHRMVAKTAGNSGTNVGNIYVGTGTVDTGEPAVVENLILPGEGQTQAAFYAVPAGTKFLISSVHNSAATGNKIALLHLAVKPLGGLFNVKANEVLVSAAVTQTFDLPLVVDEKSIVEVFGRVDSVTGLVAASFNGTLIGVTAAQRANLT